MCPDTSDLARLYIGRAKRNAAKTVVLVRPALQSGMKAVAAARPTKPVFFLADWLVASPQTEAEKVAFVAAREPTAGLPPGSELEGMTAGESSSEFLQRAITPAIQPALAELVKVAPPPVEPCLWMAEELRRITPLGFVFQV